MTDQPEKTFTKTQRDSAFVLGLLCGAVVMFIVMALVGMSLNNANNRQDSATAATQTTTRQQSAVPTTQGAQQPTTAQASAGAGNTRAPSSGGTTPLQIDMSRRVANDPLALGKVDAPVVIVEYADYRCPFCSKFSTETQPTLVNEYEQRARPLEFRDFPIFGEDSINAAIAGRAAGNQGKFWEFHAAVARDGVAAGGHPDLPRPKLIAYAQEVGVQDIAKFTADLDDPLLKAAVDKDAAEAQSLGAQSVPAFLVGDTALIGAQPVDVFRQAIEKELQDAGVQR